MYDANLLREAMASHGLNPYRLGKKADVDPKTAKGIVTKGRGHPENVYKVAKALGFDVKKNGAEFDLSVIVKRHGEESAATPKQKRARRSKDGRAA